MPEEGFDSVRARFETYEQLRDEVARNGDLLEVAMGDLRDIQGAGKLGSRVRQEIQQGLAGVGLGSFPGSDLPAYQELTVRVYRRGTRVGGIVDAVLFPSKAGDELLAESTGLEAATVLKQIRALVCD